MARVLDSLIALADRIDRLPVSPSRLGDGASRHFVARRQARAAADPGWVAIEERRETGGASRVFLGRGLTLADWETQAAIASARTPDPFWLPSALAAAHWRLGHPLRVYRERRELMRCGWSGEDLVALDRILCRRLGAQLQALSETAHVWPECDSFPSFEDWEAALARNGALLLRYALGGEDGELSSALDAWHELATRAESPPEKTREAFDAHRALEEEITKGAKDALHWVADNLSSLWD